MSENIRIPALTELEELLEFPSCELGKIISMNYAEATFVTNDFKTKLAGGVPKMSYLIAVPTSTVVNENGEQVTEEKIRNVILLRVDGIGSLETSNNTRSLREELAIKNKTDIDIRTQATLETIAYSCSITGTFYYDENGDVSFGADVDELKGNSLYSVYKPRGRALSLIASYSNSNSTRTNDNFLKTGVTRYSDTQASIDHDATVYIDVNDFIGKKTAIFGMSRSGKAFPCDTRIPVPISEKFPLGWATNQELEVGDFIFGTDGAPVEITNLTDWEDRQVYGIKFSDGQTVRAADNHIWKVSNYSDRIYLTNSNMKSALEKKSRKSEKIKKLLDIAANYEVGDYATAGFISEVINYSQDRVSAIVKNSGIEGNLDHEISTLSNKTLYKNTKVYPIKETIHAVAKSYENTGQWKQKEDRLFEKLVSTEDLLNESLKNTKNARTWSVALFEPNKEIKNSSLPITPYILGAWLGEGRSAQGYITADKNPDSENLRGRSDLECLKELVEKEGYTWNDVPSDTDTIGIAGLTSELIKLDLRHNKHIPPVYLRASFEQRLELMRGLMDTDGCITKSGNLELGFSDEKLANGVLELIRSLGIRVSISTKSPFYKKDGLRIYGKIHYRFNFSTDLSLFKYDRKFKKQNYFIENTNRGKKFTKWLAIDGIQKAGIERVRCITVQSNDSMFLVEGFIPTHNSNTIKTIVKKVFTYGEINTPIAQLIFDPQGEYANANKQDSGALSNLGDEDKVRIYKIIRDDETPTPKEDHLQMNLMDPSNARLFWDLMLEDVEGGISGTASYITDLRSVRFYKGKSMSSEDKDKLNFQLFGLYALCGTFVNSDVFTLSQPLNIEIGPDATEIAAESPILEEVKPGFIEVHTTEAAAELFEWMMENETSLVKDLKRAMSKGPLAVFNTHVNHYKAGRNGVFAAFRRVIQLHNDRSTGDVRNKIWNDMVRGRLVIVDLSKGSNKTSKTLSELIVKYLITRSAKMFTNNEELIRYQIIVEEAHNLFSRSEITVDDDPWIRMSKEAAKYKIGLVYATQEVTGVAQQILSNTSNWFVAHLNSTIETNELSKYYSFGDWADHLKKVESKGFVRMKTESSPYIVPVQIELFIAEENDTEVETKKSKKVEKSVDETKSFTSEDYNGIF